jgi:prepilin-type N-terminal cleavage/methylation domain-containing protein
MDGDGSREPRVALAKAWTPARGGFTVLELMVVMSVIAIMIALAMPSFQRAIEQAKADVAVANLRSCWSAERFYWMDNRAYTSDLSQLQSLDLIDPSLTSSAGPYTYTVTLTHSGGFLASANRVGSSYWSGGFSIDETGQVTGVVQAPGERNITPAPQ